VAIQDSISGKPTISVILQRLEPAAAVSFWQSDLKPGLLTEGGVDRGQWSKCYAYIVNEWRSPFAEPLLEARRLELPTYS